MEGGRQTSSREGSYPYSAIHLDDGRAEFLFALVLTATPQAMTFPVGVQGLVTQFEIIWNDMAAGGVIAILIPLAILVMARRHVMAGLTFGVIREQ